MTDYSLWEVILNGNKVLKKTVGETEQEYEPTTTEENQDRRNEMKARGTLLMALPNKDQLKSHSYKDAKLIMEAIEKRYGGNKESKKVQRTLLKQQYENFAGSNSETMDQTFDRFQKLISQLKIQDEVITQEDMNLKLLRSLPSEWKNHALIWRNKEEIETISLDVLYNNLKIYESEITGSSNNTAYRVSVAHTQSNPTSGDNLSDAVISRRFIKRTDRKLDVNGQRVGFDRSKVECYNCHKYGHFARECKAPRNQENRGREINRRTITVETPTENALVTQDGIGGSDSEVNSCSKSCVKAYATLKEQYDSLSSDYKRSQFNLVSYKAGLESVEARLAHYKKNEAVFEESINVLKLEVKLRDTALVENKKKLEKAEKERDELKLTLEKFQNSSKSLNNLLESQVIDKFKTGLGYNAASSTAASPAVESFVNSSEMLENQENNKSKSDKGYHAVPPPFTGKFHTSRFVPQAVLTKSGKINTAGASVNTAVRPVNTAGSKPTVNHPRPISNAYKRDIHKVKDTTARDRAVESENKGKGVNVVKASTCWVWKAKNGHMTRNKCYLTEYEDYDGGFISFGDGKGRISGKGKIKTGTLDFDNVYFCKELNYLMKVKCLLRVTPRKDNIYSVDLKSVVPTKGLTCLFAKATIDESNLWHRRLGHINFKNMNKLVRGNLVRGLPSKIFENDHSCVACQKGKQHKASNGPDWLFDIDSLTLSMNYVPVVAGNQTNGIAGTRDNIVTDSKVSEEDAEEKPTEIEENGASDKDGKDDQATKMLLAGPSFTNDDPSSPVNAAEASNAFEEHLFEIFSPFKNVFTLPPVLNMTLMDDTRIFGNAYDDEDVGTEADLNNLETTMNASPIPTTRINKDHPKDQIIRDFNSAIQTMRMTNISDEHTMTLVDLPNGKRAIGTKWVFRNKKDEIGIMVRNKARLVAQGYTQEERIDYDEIFAPVARIEAIRLFLAYASFMGFIVYQMDVKSAFLYGTIDEETMFANLLVLKIHNFLTKFIRFRRGTIDKTLFIKKDKGDILLVQVYVDDIIFGSTKKSLYDEFKVQQKKDGIFISQDKYMADILKKFDFATVKIASTPMEPNKALIKDEEADSVDVYLYRSMIRSLMYLTASRPDIMFAVCACAGFQVTPKTLHLHAVKRIFRYLKGQPKLGLWKSTTGAEYVAAANCCGHVLWIKNQMLDYGFNFMNTKIYIDNESTICIMKNLVFHSKTKHIEIRHHFIRDCYEKKLIQVIKIHTYHNVADLLTKAFDVSRMERTATTASSLDAEQDSGNINRTQSMATLNESFPQGTDSGSGPRCQDTILGGADAQTRFKTTFKQSNDPPLSRGYTLVSGEESLKLLELMELCTKLSDLVSKKKREML
ncbi:putative ribonuclease H-like domain-containing protein [Tanacetum coccineum]|uniref:Ribonuclease H-like domain-containing protein n=1 Tax=Tanacetum coccineum TaxID=301880 RepID=A0ABQ5GIK3_9ASTR